MTILLVASLALTVSLAIIVIVDLVPASNRALDQRLADIRALGADEQAVEKRRRLFQGDWIMAVLQELGARLRPNRKGAPTDRAMLTQAGYRSSGAVAIYWGIRLALAAGFGLAALALMSPMGISAPIVLLAAVYFAAIGYIMPYLRVQQQRRARQKEIQLALADTLDLLVVCVEAGLGLNQAMVRVADEIRHISDLTSEELLLTNAEIRAGTPRDQSLRRLAERTGVEDLNALVTMLIQTDRFGTSVARSLRVHSDVLRQKRRQRAEEAAAKTAIKMVFPLVFCIFPAMFVVILGPGMIQIFRTLSAITP